MEKLIIRVRRRVALAGLLVSTLGVAFFSIGGFWLIRARNPSGALAPWWLQALTILLCAFYVVIGLVAIRGTLRELAGVPRATLDERGIDLPGVGVVDWSDVRDVEVIRRRRSAPRVRMALDRWEKYAARQPAWLRHLERWSPNRHAVILYLAGTDIDPIVVSTLIRERAAQHRRPAA